MTIYRYRPEIDGLRAIAVLAIVIFHAKLEIGGMVLFTGGYIGVDVFFVISGYLITSIILKDMEADSFKLLNFYQRRARRILPASVLCEKNCAIGNMSTSYYFDRDHLSPDGFGKLKNEIVKKLLQE
jgi:hypothetical protein